MSLPKVSKRLLQSLQWKSATLKNGIKLYSQEDHYPISRLGIMYKAGPRFEAGDHHGMSHILNAQLGNSKDKCSPLNLVRSVSQMGASLCCGVHREYIYYYVECCRNLLNEVSPFLVLAAVHPEFKPWEVEDSQQLLSHDIDRVMGDSTSVVLDKLHEAAFRRGLGNSLYSRRTSIHHQALNRFHEGIARSGRTTLVGLGVSMEDLERFGRLLDVKAGKAEDSAPSSFHSSEVRVSTGSSVGHAAVVVSGACLGAREDHVCSNVLKTLLGDDYGVNNAGASLTSRLGSAFMSGQASHVARGLSFSYSDAGLVGYYVSASSADVGQAVVRAQKEFESILGGHVTREEFERAKCQYKGLLARRESRTKFERALPCANLGLPVEDLGEMLRGVDSLEFETFLHFLSSRGSRFAMAAVGGIGNVPYLDELTN